jgi:hypothetical protein
MKFDEFLRGDIHANMFGTSRNSGHPGDMKEKTDEQ